jgi:hypothetical protein
MSIFAYIIHVNRKSRRLKERFLTDILQANEIAKQ